MNILVPNLGRLNKQKILNNFHFAGYEQAITELTEPKPDQHCVTSLPDAYTHR